MGEKKINKKKTAKSVNDLDINAKKMAKLRQKVRIIFTTAGFSYIPSNSITMHVGLRDIELDMVFLYENIIVICEDTTDSHKTDHALKKQEAFNQIEQNKNEFIEIFKKKFPNQKDSLDNYNTTEFIIKYLYFTIEDISFDDETLKRFNLIRFVNPDSIEYLYQITNCIKKSAKYELFRFLQIGDKDIGVKSSVEGKQQRVKATIISPQGSIGLEGGMRAVSFMMKAEDLIKNSYVMRKDNWEESAFLYQRLIKKDRIESIRNYMLTNERAFLNNIIVSLPKDIQFYGVNNKPVDLKDINEHGAYTMELPDEMNSICIIDGQHRIYAHYESDTKDEKEKKMERMRKRLHLLVTGIIYPDGYEERKRAKFESQLFLDINTNAKPVPPEVLIFIQAMANPLSPNGLARAVVERMNKKGPFEKKLETTSLGKGTIKTSSMIKYALRNFVDINSKKKYFYHYWSKESNHQLEEDGKYLDEYINYCIANLNSYFSVVKQVFANYWDDDNSKLLSSISINGFIIAYGYCMDKYGIRDHIVYKETLERITLDFTKENFPYTSSQYNKFAREIINPCFDEVLEVLNE